MANNGSDAYWFLQQDGFVSLHYHPFTADDKTASTVDRLPQWGWTPVFYAKETFTPGTTGIRFVARIAVNPDIKPSSKNPKAPPAGLNADGKMDLENMRVAALGATPAIALLR